MADTALIRNAVKWVRHNGVAPRVHPNGFIQLDLTDDGTRVQRLHVWPDGDEIPKQTTLTTIHDHRFDMRSTVLTGTLIQRTYLVNTTPTFDGDGFSHEIFMAQYPEGRKESQLLGTGVKVAVYHRDRPERIVEGRSYTQLRYTFHDTEWEGLTATLMEKTGEDIEHTPRVLVPLGQAPDNTFVRSEVNTDLLWDYIDRALGTPSDKIMTKVLNKFSLSS